MSRSRIFIVAIALLSFFLLPVLLQAGITFSGKVSRSGITDVETFSPPGLGSLRIETIGEHTTEPVLSAPYVTVWTDGQTPALYNKTVTNLSTGNIWSRSQFPWGLTPYVGTCTYAEGFPPCTVSSFSRLFNLSSSVWGCDASSCRYQVSITGGQVTKVVWKWIGEYEGFGASTVGGRSGTVCLWTNLNDSGSGSLRNCVNPGGSQSSTGTWADNVYVVCQVSGTLALNPTPDNGYGPILIKGKNITIDGFTCPSPGVTITNYGIWIKSALQASPPINRDVSDVIVRNLAIRSMYSSIENCTAGFPCLSGWSTVMYTGETNERNAFSVPPHNIVFANMSISDSIREPYTMAFLAYDATSSYNLFTHQKGFRQGTLFDEATHQTMHHTVLSNTGARNPQAVYDHGPDIDPDTSLDFRYNIIGIGENPNTGFWGLNLTHGVKANAVGNYFIGLPTVDATINPSTGVCTYNSEGPGDSCGSDPLDIAGSGINNAWSYCFGPGAGGNSNNWQGSCGKQESLCDIYGQFPVGGVFSSANVVTSAFNPAPLCNINQHTPNVSEEFPAPEITSSGNALTEVCKTKAIAGRWPRDAHDTAELGLISLTGCSAFSLGSGT